MSEIGPFYRELFSFLQESGLEHLDQAAPLDQIVHDYHELWSEKNAIQVERQWMTAFSAKEFAELGLSAPLPKLYRGLPRLYHRDDPSVSRIKKNFSHLPTLKALSVDRAVFS